MTQKYNDQNSVFAYIYVCVCVCVCMCGVKELSSPDPLHTRPKAHAEEKETSEDEQRESKLLRDIAEDNPVLGQPKS